MAGASQNEVPGGYTADAPSTPDGKTIYFSLVSLCDVAPPTAADTSEVAALIPALHEDDWRQIEFAPEANRPLLGRMVAALSAFKSARSIGSGFSGIYVRQELPHPLSSSGLTLPGLRAALPSGEFIPAFRISSGGATAQVVGGFAIRLHGLGWLYGHAKSDTVQSLGLIIDQSSEKPSPRSSQELSELLRSRKLLLVDWYSILVVPEPLSSWIDTWKQARGDA